VNQRTVGRASHRSAASRSPRVLLLVPAQTYRAADFLAAATRMRLDLMVASDGALPLGGCPVIRVDTRDLERSADRLVSCAAEVDAVVAVDTSMLVLAAHTAARLGLRHNPVRAVMASLDKAEQRRLWAAADIAQPAFVVIPASTEADEVTRAVAGVGFPCVIKAVSLSGSRGVLRADDGPSAAAAVRRIRQVLASADRPDGEPLLAEQYISGPELSIDGILTNGSLTVTGVFDKPDTPSGPTFEETLLTTPSQLPPQLLEAALRTAERAAGALGLRSGPIHAELRVDYCPADPVPMMLELAARSIGGLCARALRCPSGMSIEEMVLSAALGLRPLPPRLPRPAGVLMLYPDRAGMLRAVEGTTEAAAVPGVTGLNITMPPGHPVRPLPDGDRYIGFIFAEGRTHKETADALRAARRELTIIIQ
jgi:biotin carboxylase